MVVKGQLNATAALSTLRAPQYPLNSRVGPRPGVHTSGEERNRLFLPGIEHRLLRCVTPGLVSVPADIFLIHSVK
jgi:hypothetical protein